MKEATLSDVPPLPDFGAAATPFRPPPLREPTPLPSSFTSEDAKRRWPDANVRQRDELMRFARISSLDAADRQYEPISRARKERKRLEKLRRTDRARRTRGEENR